MPTLKLKNLADISTECYDSSTLGVEVGDTSE